MGVLRFRNIKFKMIKKMLNNIIRFFLKERLVTVLSTVAFVAFYFSVVPFNWGESEWLPKDSVPVDAIPNMDKNQQIVYTDWKGKSPQDIEDQVQGEGEASRYYKYNNQKKIIGLLLAGVLK